MERRTLTVPEVAESLGISPNLARKLIRAGQIRSVRLGRKILVAREEIDRVLAVGETA